MILFVIISDDDNQMIEKYYIDMRTELNRIAYSILKSYISAEEAVQEAFVRITAAIDSFRNVPDEKKRGYCFMVVRNISINMYNKEKNQRIQFVLLEDSYLEPKDATASIPELVETKEDIEILKNMINQLDSNYKAPLMLRFADGLSYKEISALLHISESLARKRVERAISKLSAYKEEESVNGKYRASDKNSL